MFSTCVFVLEEMSNVAAALKLHFFPRVWRILLVNTESGSLLFDERRTKREKERERAFVLLRPSLSSIARINTRSGKECVVVVPSRGNQSNRSNHIKREKDAHIHAISHHGDKSPAHNDAADQPHLPFPANEKQSADLAVRTRRERRRSGRANRRFRRVHESRPGRLRGGEARRRCDAKDERRESFIER